MCERERRGEIEVTPGMIEAGVRTLYDSGAIESPIYSNDQALVRRVFLSMLDMYRTSHPEGL